MTSINGNTALKTDNKSNRLSIKNVDCLPKHGKVNCNKCFSTTTSFDVSTTGNDDWRITSNPLSWGTQTPEIIVLGFSKGPTQAGALNSVAHNDIAYKGSRKNVGKILNHIGIIKQDDPTLLTDSVNELIENVNGHIHFGSLVRCTVERYDRQKEQWKGSGGSMLDKFVKDDFGNTVVTNCMTQHLGSLPQQTKLIILFGLGTKLNYVKETFKLFSKVRNRACHWLNEISYTDGKVTVVHVEHFAAQGALIPNWLGKNDHIRKGWGQMAKDSVQRIINCA